CWCRIGLLTFDSSSYVTQYTLSLHDALPISGPTWGARFGKEGGRGASARGGAAGGMELLLGAREARRLSSRFSRTSRRRASLTGDRKSTRLNSSHVKISYAVFCMKKKK